MVVHGPARAQPAHVRPEPGDIAPRAQAAPRGLAAGRSVLPPAALPLGVALAPLLLGTLVGLPFALSPGLALERTLGLILAGAGALAASVWLHRVPGRRLPAVLLVVAAAVLAHALWVAAAAGPSTFRGGLGEVVNRVLAPLYGRFALADPLEVINTRFMWGVSNLTLVPLILGTAVLLARPGRGQAVAAGGLALASLLLLLATGQRGALLALGVGWWVVALAWWRRRWLLLLAPLAAMVVLALGAAGLLDKGLDVTSTTGRVTYWADLLRLLLEYPLTGSGLGLDTANAVAVAHEINPDPQRVFYAHNTFVQTAQEQGPLGVLGMALLPLLAAAAGALALREPAVLAAPGRRALVAGSLGVVAALEVHGLTDQVIPTIVGTLLLLLAIGALLSQPGADAEQRLAGWARRTAAVPGAVALVALVLVAALPAGRAQALLDLGGLQLNQALAGAAPEGADPDRARLAAAEQTLRLALAQDPTHPAVLRNLARAQVARFDVAGALVTTQALAASPRLDAFDRLQVARLYRDLGFAAEAYAWATAAYEAWGRTPPAPVMQAYRQATVQDDFRVRDLAVQGEAALVARSYAEALTLFRQALAFAPENAYLRDRVGDAERGLSRPGASPP